MKRKIFAVMLIVIVATSILSGCSKENEIKNAQQISDNNTIYGEVSGISDDSITIKVGALNMEKRTGEMSSEGETMSEGEVPNPGGMDSMIELTGEEKEIKITDDTVIKEQIMGGFGRGNMGNPSEIPTGEDGSRPEMPSGESGQGTPPEMPSGEQGTPPEMPSNGDGQGNPPEMPSGEDASRPEMPSGEGGSMPEGGRGQGDFGQMTEEIDLEDILEGDTVAITLDTDGNAKEIIVMIENEMKELPNREQESTNNQAKNKGKYEVA